MLDTNIVSELIRSPGGRAAARARAAEGDIVVSIVVAAELRYGCAKKGSAPLRQRVDAFLSEVAVVPLDVSADDDYGRIRAALEARGTSIGSNDLLIAAHALALGATLVTANGGEFQRVDGLRIENWMAA